MNAWAANQKLEKVKAFELVNGECNIIWEPVKFQEQYIPEVSTIISTAVIGFVAASSPIILNAIKPIIKKLITRKKNHSRSAFLSRSFGGKNIRERKIFNNISICGCLSLHHKIYGRL